MYRKTLFVLSLLIPCGTAPALIDIDDRIMGRGDANNDDSVDLSDVIYLNAYLFNGGDAPSCLNNADSNDDGVVDGSDSIYVLAWIYSNGPEPPAPGPYNTVCAFDPIPNPGCAEDPCP